MAKISQLAYELELEFNEPDESTKEEDIKIIQDNATDETMPEV